MRVLFLDDNWFRCAAAIRTFSDQELYITHTSYDAIAVLSSSGSFGYVTLDHDLNGESYVDSSRQDCGMEVVRWISANKPTIGTVNVHSWNDGASEAMVDALRDCGYSVERRRFGDNGFVEGE